MLSISIALFVFVCVIFGIWFVLGKNKDTKSQNNNPPTSKIRKLISISQYKKLYTSSCNNLHIKNEQNPTSSQTSTQYQENIQTILESETTTNDDSHQACEYEKQECNTRFQRAQSILQIQPRYLLNREEQQIFSALLKLNPKDKDKKFNIHPQVSFNSFVKYASGNQDDYLSGNALSVDFLITQKHLPVAVIEYHGGGHYSKNEEIRKRTEDNDQTKQYMCERMNLVFIVLKQEDIKEIESVLRSRVFDRICLE